MLPVCLPQFLNQRRPSLGQECVGRALSEPYQCNKLRPHDNFVNSVPGQPILLHDGVEVDITGVEKGR